MPATPAELEALAALAVLAALAAPVITYGVIVTKHHTKGETMSHAECGAPGRYDCWADEKLDNLLIMEGGVGEGSVDLAVGWFSSVDLDPVGERDLVTHYGSRWLIARMNDQGFFRVLIFETEAARAEVMRALLTELDENLEEEE